MVCWYLLSYHDSRGISYDFYWPTLCCRQQERGMELFHWLKMSPSNCSTSCNAGKMIDWHNAKLVLVKNRQFFRTPTFKPLLNGHTTGAKIQPRQSDILCNAKISVCTHWVDTNHPHCLGKLSCDSIPSPVAMAHWTPDLAMCNRQVTVGLIWFYCFQLWYNFHKNNLLLK